MGWYGLSDSEHEIMKYIWKHEEVTLREVVAWLENGVGTKRFGQVFYFQNRISIHLSLPPFTSVSIFLSLSKLPSPG